MLAVTATHGCQLVDILPKAGKLGVRPATQGQRRQLRWGEVEPGREHRGIEVMSALVVRQCPGKQHRVSPCLFGCTCDQVDEEHASTSSQATNRTEA